MDDLLPSIVYCSSSRQLAYNKEKVRPMSVPYLEYQLQNGYIDNWLVAGPQAAPVADLDRFVGDDYKLQIARHYHQRDSGIDQPPAERDTFAAGEATLTWRYARCRDDHFVDLSAFYHTCHYLRAWAYAEVFCPEPQVVTCILTTNGPADVWLNGRHIHRQEHFHHQLPHSVTLEATLQAGSNRLLVRMEEVAVRECPYAMALQVGDGALPVRLPTLAEQVARRQLLERVFAAAYLDRDVYGRNDEIVVRWPDTLAETSSVALRVQRPSGEIFGESWPVAQAGLAFGLLKGMQLLDGAYQVTLLPPAEEFYIGNVRVQRNIPLWVLRNAYAEKPYGNYETRRREALADAAERESGMYSEIAKMELERWPEVKAKVILESIAGIDQRADCSDFYLVGLLGMLYRYADDPAFPQEINGPLEQCVLGFKYWMDEPGSDAMCYWSENHQILFHTCEILAGQLYPERVFGNAGQDGAWHRAKGERMALSWLRKRAAGGFREWDSNCYFEHDVLALAHLADLADDQHVRELAAVVLDKLLFSMALNSFHGAFGSTHGRTYTPMIKGARLEPTAGISRLAWGMGVFNQHLLGSVGLACAQGYELPPIIAQIAADQPDELWSRERHAGELEQWSDLGEGAWEVNKVTYKTPDYMLCSAQDYRPGEPGYQQHIWQATLGPDAVVFATNPPCVSEEGSHRPNFWHGNVTLPRVAQWKDALIAIHNLPDDDWLDFTHAYFPLAAFDEHALRDGWAFARQGDGYLALTAAQGLALTTQGDSAYRELRSAGRQNIWLCHMGRAALDGSFAEFQHAVLTLDVRLDGLSAQCSTLRGDMLAFGWQGPLLLNGQEQLITGFKHYDNPYCSNELGEQSMEIRYGEQLMRLHFS
jgi:hypothetical protein